MVNPTSATATQIKFLVPFQATTGKISIKVGAITVNSATDLTITATPAPVINAITGNDFMVGRSIVSIAGTNLARTAPNAPQPKYFMKDAGGQDVEMKVIGTATNTSAVLQIPATAVTSPIKIVTFAGQDSEGPITLKIITATNFANLANVGGSILALAVGADGTVYGIDRNAIVKFSSTGGLPTVIAGVANTSGAVNGTGTAARFNFPRGLVVDANNNLYVADTENHVIRKVTPAGVVTVHAGSFGVPGFAAFEPWLARFNKPWGLSMNSDGNSFLVADNGNKAIRNVNVSNGTVFDINGGPSVANNPFNNIKGITSLLTDIYVADETQHVVHRALTGTSVRTEFGTLGQAGFVDANTNTKLNAPIGVLRLGGQDIFITDKNNHCLRWGRRSTNGNGIVSTVVGASPNANGQGTAGNPFTAPTALAGIANASGYTIYVASEVGAVTKIVIQ
jgi:NHL repeat